MFFRYKLTIHPDGSQSWEPLSPEDGDSLTSDQPQKRRRSSRHPDSRFIPIREAADISGFHRDSLKNYCRAGQIDYSLDKGRWHVNRASLDEFLERITIKQRRRPGRPGRPRILDGE